MRVSSECTYRIQIDPIRSFDIRINGMATNAQLGKIVLTIAVSVFCYYFFWVAILPFMLIDEGNPLHSLFPPLKYAFIVPVVFGVIFLGGIAIFTFYHIWNFRKTKRD